MAEEIAPTAEHMCGVPFDTYPPRAKCSCGWRGPLRADDPSAQRDAAEHVTGGVQ